MSKKCYKCQSVKEYLDFSKCLRNKDGYQDSCKSCKKEYDRLDRLKNREKYNKKSKKWRDKNVEKVRASAKKYRDNNKDKTKAAWKKYQEENREELCKKRMDNYWKNVDKNREKQRIAAKRDRIKRKEYKRKYIKENKDQVNLRRRNYRKNNLEKFKINYHNPKNNVDARMSAGIRQSLKGNKNGRHWEDLVGYTNDELRKHLESKFTNEMNWEVFSSGEITIDHKVCKELFEYNHPEEEQFKACWALSNLQPMFFKDNAQKSDLLPDGRRARDLTKNQKLMYLIKLGYDFGDGEDQICG